MVNVTIYSIHGSYGYGKIPIFILKLPKKISPPERGTGRVHKLAAHSMYISKCTACIPKDSEADTQPAPPEEATDLCSIPLFLGPKCE